MPHYGESATGGYDSGQDVSKFFEELREAADELRAVKDKMMASFAPFDYAYGGDLNKWAKLCNTIRLRHGPCVSSEIRRCMGKERG